MANGYVTHSDLVYFAETKVNLHRNDAKEYREQVGRLRENIGSFIDTHPNHGLVKMLLSGSLAKGTALKTLNDIDVALYVESKIAPSRIDDLVDWLAQRLREAYPNIAPDKISPGRHCVRISFSGSGLDVDVVPVYYEGAPDDRGYLYARDSGNRVLTSIPLHLRFIRCRKSLKPIHFAQIIRLIKWWGRSQKQLDSNFRFKSFMAEMITAELLDQGTEFSDYPNAMESVFKYIVRSQLKKRISFSDYYSISQIRNSIVDPIQIFDPVNPDNNIAQDYDDTVRIRIVQCAERSLEKLAEARYATTRERAVDCWKAVLGPSFGV
ncbi:MAG: nucleotidyltransferase [Candidatus Hydrogenedentes bacterium]|nr:nucleotidyltransferase [Candidatus Hydrogenedentota bacterium]